MGLDYSDVEWGGSGQAKRSEWSSFTVGFGEPGNMPDVDGSSAGGVIVQKAIGGTITGSGNIYSPVGPADFELWVAQESGIEELVVQVRSIGALDNGNVVLTVPGEDMPRVPQTREIGVLPGEFGSTVIQMFSWKLTGSGIQEGILSFKAVGPHLSLDGVRMDVLLAVPQVVDLKYVDPAWGGSGQAKRSEWSSFAVGFGEPGNMPDVDGSSAGGVIVQKAIGGTITGSGNIYNPVGPADFELRVAQESGIEELVVQVRSIGALDNGNVVLTVPGEDMPRVPQTREIGVLPGEFGSTIIQMFSWKLTGSGIQEGILSFKAVGPHLSLDGVRMDVLVAVPQVRVIIDSPLHDRWNYNFNAAPGSRPKASIFRAVEDGIGVFRHGTFDMVFEVSQDSMEIVQPQSSLKAARLHIMTTSGFAVPYDSTMDAIETWFPESDPRYVVDADAGRPIELFGLKFNHDLDIMSWTESSPFAPGADQPRHVVPAGFDADGQFQDVSLAVDFLNPSHVLPFAVGRIENHPSGEDMPFDTWMVFDVDLTQSSVAGYFAQALELGKLGLSVTSLNGGALGDRAFPEFYTKESIEGESPWMELIFEEAASTEMPFIQSIQVGPENIVITLIHAVAGQYQIRWSEDLKSWNDVLDPVVETIGANQVRWTDNTTATHKYYQVQPKP